MLQTIARLSPVGFVADDLGKSQCRQNVTYPEYAAPEGSRDLTGAQFVRAMVAGIDYVLFGFCVR